MSDSQVVVHGAAEGAHHEHLPYQRHHFETYAQQTGVSGDLDALNDLPSGGLSRMAVNVLFGVRTPQEVQTVRGASTDSDLERIVAGEE